MGARSKLDRYLRRGHKLVEGWMPPGAADMIVAMSHAQQKFQVTGHVAEIGVHHGKLFILLCLLRAEGEWSVAVDLFGDQDRNIDASGEGDREKLLENLRRYADVTHLILHQGDSLELDGKALVALAGGHFRLISIDGGHSAEITAHDLTTAENALVQAGVIVLDDCFNEMWPGVSDGVHEYFTTRRSIVPFAVGANKVLFCRPPYVDHYVEVLRNLPTKMVDRSFLGYRVLCCDFTPLALTEKVGRMPAWIAVKDIGPVPLLRRSYRRVAALARTINW
jgi:hypothetical protein